MTKRTWHLVATSAAMMVMLGVMQACAVTHLGRNKAFGPQGLISDTQGCNAACAERVDVPGGGEKCVRFSKGMADVCQIYKDKTHQSGTFVMQDPA